MCQFVDQLDWAQYYIRQIHTMKCESQSSILVFVLTENYLSHHFADPPKN